MKKAVIQLMTVLTVGAMSLSAAAQQPPAARRGGGFGMPAVRSPEVAPEWRQNLADFVPLLFK